MSDKIKSAVMGDPVVKAAIEDTGAPSTVEANTLAVSREYSETALRTEGQRSVNLLWENSQATIAKRTVSVLLLVAGLLSLLVAMPWATDQQAAISSTAFMLLGNLGSLIVGFYFGRTNHTRVGGVGTTDQGR